YFLPPGVAVIKGTLYFFEAFQEEIRKGNVILHQPSKTLYGGFTGIVCVVHALTQIYLNCLAVRGDFKPPEDIPAGYNVSRFPIHKHDRIASWMDEWIAVIKQKTEILAKTSPERKDGLSLVTARPTSKDSDHGSSSDSDSRKFANHDESDESDEKGPEIDFEAMDITSQDDKSSDKEAWD
ncbi:hypothetical protein FRC11_014286, partial [Ceratobasidium sp. 423]